MTPGETAARHPRSPRELLGLAWATIYKFFGDGCAAMAASLSFYTFFSLPALLTLLLSIVGRVMDPERVQQAIVGQVGGLIGTAGAKQVRAIIASANDADAVTLTAALSGLLLAFGATTAFAQLQSALNKIWKVKPDPRRNQIRVFLLKRVFSFGVVITVAFLLLVSLAFSTALALVGERMNALPGPAAALLEVTASLVGFAVTAVLFAAMFRYLPDARIAWRDVRAGAIASALLFTLGKVVIGYYLGNTDPGNAYGAAGSLAVVLLWVYYTSMVLLMGAEFTEQWAERYGPGIVPEHGAVAYVEQEREVAAR